MPSPNGRISAVIVLMMFSAIGIMARAVDAQAPVLDEKARAAIATFGEGVIKPSAKSALPEGVVEDPLSYAGLTPGTAVWKLVTGKGAGKMVNRTVQPHPAKQLKHIVVTEGFHTSIFQVDDDSIFRTTQVSVEHATITTFKPFEPVLMAKLGPGKLRKQSLALEVHTIEQPSVVTHTGTLEAEYEVLGTFDVHVPAGDFAAIGVRVTYSGSVGPASIDDESYIFFVKDVGPVAIRARSHISAFLIYNERRSESMILVRRPNAAGDARPVGSTD